jgi:hypothetical protein
VTVNTVFERSKIPLTKWLAALFLMTASKKGISAHQVHRMLGISYKSTWFLMHRLREAMRVGDMLRPMGGEGGAVEVDKTYIGRLQGVKKKRAGVAHKNTVLSLLDRDTGKVRSFHVANATVGVVAPIVRDNISKEAHLITDQAKIYQKLGTEFSRHDTVNHQEDEYVRREGDVTITTALSKATSAYLSAICSAPTSTAARSICIAISQNLISAITTAPRSELTTRTALPNSPRVSLASA